MQIQPIHNDADHIAAVKRIEVLMGVAPESPEGDELDILATLVVAYEKQHYPMPPPDPISAILFCMEQQELTRRDLEPLIGSRARVSEVLSGRRRLTLPMIRRLNATLKIPADILIGTSEPPAKTRGNMARLKSSPSRPAQRPVQRPVQKQSSAAARRRAV